MIDPKNYQVIVEGRTVQVLDLTKDELVQEVCKLLDFLEDIEQIANKLSSRIDKERSE